jgi:hypothetical protein
MVLISIPLVIISTLAVISFLGTSFIFSGLSSSLSASLSGAAPDRISSYTYGHPSGYNTRVETADSHSPSLVPWIVVPSILGVSIGQIYTVDRHAPYLVPWIWEPSILGVLVSYIQ